MFGFYGGYIIRLGTEERFVIMHLRIFKKTIPISGTKVIEGHNSQKGPKLQYNHRKIIFV